jgi:hypothetical protein
VTFRIDFSALRTVDVRTLEPGRFFMASPRRAAALIAPGVRCADYENPAHGTSLVTTKDGLRLRPFSKGTSSGISVIALDLELSSLRMEVGGTTPSATEGIAELLFVNPDGAWISVLFEDPQYNAARLVYLSLSNWEMDHYQPDKASAFAEWKLGAEIDGRDCILLQPAKQSG